MRRVGAHVSVAGGLINAIANTENIGGNCLQIFAGSPRTWARKLYSEKEATEFNQAIEQKDYRPVFIHALYLVNLGTDQADLLKKSTDSLLFDLKNGDLIKAAGVIVHLGSHQGRSFPTIKSQVVDQINNLLSQTEATPFVIENSAGQQGKIGTLEEIAEIFKEIKSDRLKLCLDTAHLFEAGFDLRDSKIVDSLIQTLSEYEILDKLVCIHLNDSKTPLSSHRDQHANLGEGEIGLEGLKNFANHPQIKHLPILLEVPGEAGLPDAKNIAIAKSL